MTKFADLHIHTHFSDGTYTPEDVVLEAVKNGLNCIAITDHDTIDGIAPVTAAAKDHDLEVIPGIEFSTEWIDTDIHILGYFLNCQNSELNAKLAQFQEARIIRIQKMIENLKGQGVNDIAFEEVCRLTQSCSVGRPHLAALLKEKGWVANISEAFERYLGEECPAYVAKFKQSPSEAIELIHRCGGAAVMAHPAVTNKDELIPGLVQAGLDGIEGYYPNCSDTVIQYYEGIAAKQGLIMTGGSDAHGQEKNYIYIGKKKVPYEVVEQLKARASRL